MDGLIESIQTEIKAREIRLREDEEKEEADTAIELPEIYKTVSPVDVDDFFKRGYAFVSSFELPECAGCPYNDRSIAVETSYINNSSCSACGQRMSYEKWVTHIKPVRPVRIVVKRARRDEDRYKFAQSPFRVRQSTPTDLGMGSLRVSGIHNGVSIDGEHSGRAPVSPEPGRSRPITDSILPLTPGNFTLDQSF